MKSMEFTREEQEVLLQLLKSSQARLEIEVLHTDHHDFKQMLKRRKDVVTGILERMLATCEQ